MSRSIWGSIPRIEKGKMLKDKDSNCPVFNRHLTDANINKLQTYYGNAICAFVGNVEAMKKACWAVLYPLPMRLTSLVLHLCIRPLILSVLP